MLKIMKRVGYDKETRPGRWDVILWILKSEVIKRCKEIKGLQTEVMIFGINRSKG